MVVRSQEELTVNRKVESSIEIISRLLTHTGKENAGPRSLPTCRFGGFLIKIDLEMLQRS